MTIILRVFALVVVLILGTLALASHAEAQSTKPNILIIWGDDIGSSMSAPTTGG